MAQPGSIAIYGHGLINVEAALQPVGPTGIPTSSSVDGALVPTASSQSTTTAGQVWSLALQVFWIMSLVLDDYDRAYTTDLASSVQSKQGGLTLESWMASRRQAASSSARVFLTPVRSFDISFARQSFSETGEEILGADDNVDFIKASLTERFGDGRKATFFSR